MFKNQRNHKKKTLMKCSNCLHIDYTFETNADISDIFPIAKVEIVANRG